MWQGSLSGASVSMLTLEMRFDLGEPQLELVELHTKATVSDLLHAIQEATDDSNIYKPQLKGQYGICAGCKTNCCRQHDITPDYLAVKRIAELKGLSLREFSERWLDVSSEGVFPQFKKRPCPFLEENLCSVYQQRALICRLYLCTPMGETLEKIRAAVSYMGEGALRIKLMEEGIGPKSWTYRSQADALRDQLRKDSLTREQYEDRMEQLHLMTEHNPFLTAESYEEVFLADCCTDFLWQKLPFKQ